MNESIYECMYVQDHFSPGSMWFNDIETSLGMKPHIKPFKYECGNGLKCTPHKEINKSESRVQTGSRSLSQQVFQLI